jgi:ADP-ribose pyrophosphatase
MADQKQKTLQPWTSLGRKTVFAVPGRLEIFADHVQLPDGREVVDFLQFESPPFVVIVAETGDGQIVCERQYKHGPGRVILTLPAGAIDAGETPLQAAQRELLEETGYAGESWQALGVVHMHANAGGWKSHAFLARGCRMVAEAGSGDLEEIQVELMTKQELLVLSIGDTMPMAADFAALLPAFLAMGTLRVA